jgi:hypothetical protein
MRPEGAFWKSAWVGGRFQAETGSPPVCRRQERQAHDLADARAGDVGQARQIGVVGHLAIRQASRCRASASFNNRVGFAPQSGLEPWHARPKTRRLITQLGGERRLPGGATCGMDRSWRHVHPDGLQRRPGNEGPSTVSRARIGGRPAARRRPIAGVRSGQGGLGPNARPLKPIIYRSVDRHLRTWREKGNGPGV